MRADGETVDSLSPDDVSIRSRVNEYGGGAVCLVPGWQRGAFAYVALADQRVWHCASDGVTPVALSPAPPPNEAWNHGGLSSSADGDWVLAVREIHAHDRETEPAATETRPRRQIVAFGTRPENRGESVILEDHDFFGSPTLDSTGSHLAVLVWDHPDMPWDSSRVVIVDVTRRRASGLEADRLVPSGPPWTVAGGPQESVGQPQWTSDGALVFVSDRAGWWQPHRHNGDRHGPGATPLTDMAAEFHHADFVLGQATVVARPDGSVVARMASDGRDSLVLLQPGRPSTPPITISQPCVNISAVCAHGDSGEVAFIGATPDAPAAVFTVTPGARQPARVWGRPRASALGIGDVSVGEHLTVVGSAERGVHGTFFPPTRRGIRGPEGDLPPLIVHCHGGPTSAASASFDVTMQYFTSRGFAVALVDYAGSTGYGRAYRCSLWGLWGEADSQDTLTAARYLAAQQRVDSRRMAIRGSSAGGLTALNALAEPDGFAAAVSWYGVTDLLGLAATTHDFEAHYTDRLIGPLPEYRRTYEARSPLNRAGELHGSVLLFQGRDDLVVPPAQAESLRDALLRAGTHCEVRFFEGEGHGFRRAETLQDCLEAELAFYRTQLGL